MEEEKASVDLYIYDWRKVTFQTKPCLSGRYVTVTVTSVTSSFRRRTPGMLSPVRYRIFPVLRPHCRLSTARRCPSCNAPLPTALPTCPVCRFIAPLPASMSYFQYFDLPESNNPYTIDHRDLRHRYLQTQRICHPDAWAQKGQKEAVLASAQSSQLNKAYQTLLSPLTRAQYILSLNGYEQNETDSIEDKEFIMEIMEARQRVEDAADPGEMTRLREVNQGNINGTSLRP